MIDKHILTIFHEVYIKDPREEAMMPIYEQWLFVA